MSQQNSLCFSCFEDITWQSHGLTENFNKEIKRYIGSVYEGLTVGCVNCGRNVIFKRDEKLDKWRMDSLEGDAQ